MQSILAPVGKWLDASTPITASVAAAVKLAGYAGIARYVPLPNNNASHDISASEAETITSAGLGLLLVQHVRTPPWLPGQHDGYSDGACARSAAMAAGYPAGSHLFLDLEGANGSAADVTRFVNDWAAGATVEGTYLAGLYVGYSAVLSPEELYALPGYAIYWSDAGHRKVATRGVAIQQGGEVAISGVKFDTDVVAPDLLGSLPMIAMAGDPPAAA